MSYTSEPEVEPTEETVWIAEWGTNETGSMGRYCFDTRQDAMVHIDEVVLERVDEKIVWKQDDYGDRTRYYVANDTDWYWYQVIEEQIYGGKE